MALIEVTGLEVTADARPILSGIDLEIEAGAGIVLLGPSGSGKTTLLRALVGAATMGAGTMRHRGRVVRGRGRGPWAGLRREVQLVWQAADAALDPRWLAQEALLEAARRVGRDPEPAQVEALLEELELEPSLLERSCDRLSGGQQQRLSLARALLAEPRLLLADEPSSAVDPPRAQAIHRLLRARRGAGMALVLATHDLSQAAGLVDEVVVLDAGQVVERGPLAQIATTPTHATTRALLAARPRWPA